MYYRQIGESNLSARMDTLAFPTCNYSELEKNPKQAELVPNKVTILTV